MFAPAEHKNHCSILITVSETMRQQNPDRGCKALLRHSAAVEPSQIRGGPSTF